MEGKSVFIVGAGISGLAAGVYLQRSGFDVTIFERCADAGGLSTSWRRGGYLFEGGMHWLTGSSPSLPLNKVWREVGALKENNPIYNRDPIYTLERDGIKLNLWRDMKKTAEEFIALSPEDKKAVERLCRDAEIFKSVHLVVKDLFGLKSNAPARARLGELLAMAPAALALPRLFSQSYVDYARAFKNEDIRNLLLAVIGARYNALSFIYTLSSFASGDCGYPEGGSRRMARNMADTFESLGGKTLYNTTVESVDISGGKARGITVGGKFIEARRILVTQDTRSAIDGLFSPPLKDAWAAKMCSRIVSEQNMQVCLGVKADLSKYPRVIVLPLEEPFEAAGISFDTLRVNNYALYENHAPAGCSAVTCLLLGQCYDWWKAKKASGEYKAEKEKIARAFVETLQRKIPEIAGRVEVTDVTTPCTYERYTGSFKGSWMSVWTPRAFSFTFPAKSKSVKNLYFASERSMMPGGLPIAVWAGRRAAQAICRDERVTFMARDVE